MMREVTGRMSEHPDGHEVQGRPLFDDLTGLIERLTDRWGHLTGAWGAKWTPTAFVGSIAHCPSRLKRSPQRTAFFHGRNRYCSLPAPANGCWMALPVSIIV